MERFDCDPSNLDTISHSGTFNDHEVAMAAGIASMNGSDAASVICIDSFGPACARAEATSLSHSA